MYYTEWGTQPPLAPPSPPPPLNIFQAMQYNADGPVLGNDDARILYQVLTVKGSTKMAGKSQKN